MGLNFKDSDSDFESESRLESDSSLWTEKTRTRSPSHSATLGPSCQSNLDASGTPMTPMSPGLSHGGFNMPVDVP